MRFRFLITAMSGSLAIATAAAAAPPTHERVPIDDSFVVEDLCAFPVTITEKGRILLTMRFDRDGDLLVESARPNIRITASNPLNGKFVTDRDVGLDKLVVQEDGSGIVLSTGIHFRMKAPKGGGMLFRRIGLQLIHLDSEGNFVGAEIVGGRFDGFDKFEQALCGALR